MKPRNKSKYQNILGKGNEYTKYTYYEARSQGGFPVYYTYEFISANEDREDDMLHITTYKLELEYKPFLWFWQRVDKHTYTALVSIRQIIKQDEDPFDVFVNTLKKLVDSSEKFVKTLDKKVILTNKMRTFDGLLYPDQIRGKKIDNLLSH